MTACGRYISNHVAVHSRKIVHQLSFRFDMERWHDRHE